MARCKATTRSGNQCKNKAKPGCNGHCTIHYRMHQSSRQASSNSNTPSTQNNNSHINLMLSEVDARLSNLERNIQRAKIPQLESRLNKCNARLSNILDLVRYQSIDIAPFYNILVSLRERLLNAHDRIEDRRNVWWRKLLKPLGACVDLILSIIGVSPIFRRALPAPDD